MTTALAVREPRPWWVTVLQRRPVRELLVLYGIEEPVKFVRHALADELRSRGAMLPVDKRELATSYLLETLCQLTKRYDPSKGLSLSTWAYGIVRRRYTDWLRGWRGDKRYGNDGREEAYGNADALEHLEAVDPVTFLSLVESIDHDRFSTRARETLRRLGYLMSVYGCNLTEAADMLGKSRREAAGDLKRLRQELAAA